MKCLALLLMWSTTLFASFQAIVFDFGGVMTTEPNREAVIAFLRESLNLSAKEFEQANSQKKEAIKAGKTDVEFWLDFAMQKGIRLPNNWQNAFDHTLQKAMGINPAMYQLVDELKQKQMRVALLSNIDERLAHLIQNWGLYEPFEPCLLSYEIGIEKPAPEAFELLLKKLNLPAKEIVFIDDKAENVEAAKKLGIDAIVFESEKQIRDELKQRKIL